MQPVRSRSIPRRATRLKFLRTKDKRPGLEGAPVPLPAAHLAPEGKVLETPAYERVHTSFELCTEKRIFVMPITF
jgi:hypothetical protein